jgi:hypothetical protein
MNLVTFLDVAQDEWEWSPICETMVGGGEIETFI